MKRTATRSMVCIGFVLLADVQHVGHLPFADRRPAIAGVEVQVPWEHMHRDAPAPGPVMISDHAALASGGSRVLRIDVADAVRVID